MGIYDKTKFTDIAVGGFLSGHVVLLRTRPVVIITGSIISTPSRIDFEAKSSTIEICLSYNGYKVPNKLGKLPCKQGLLVRIWIVSGIDQYETLATEPRLQDRNKHYIH